MSVRIVVLWLHLLAVVIWMGGVGFVALILMVTDTSALPEGFHDWFETVGRRAYVIGWEALGFIVLTGLFNLVNHARSAAAFSSDFTEALLLKLALMAGMSALQGWQHVGLLPQLTASAPLVSWRRKMLMGTAAFLVLGAGALWIGIRLRYV